MNVIVALLSIVALIAVCRRRFEAFSSFSLLLFSMASLAISALQIANVIIMQGNIDTVNRNTGSLVGGVLLVLILG